MLARALRGECGAVLLVLFAGLCACLSQTSCGTAERDAQASEAVGSERVSAETDRCELGAMTSVRRCGGLADACHVCARLDGDEGVCVQPCALGVPGQCPSGQACRPIGELRDAGGYARIGDCPAGYCR